MFNAALQSEGKNVPLVKGPLKVLFVTPHIFAGGAEKAILNLAKQLNSLGCEASIATLSVDLSKVPADFAEIGYFLPDKPFERANLHGVFSVLRSSLKELFSLAALIRRHAAEFDVVCVGNFPSYWAAYFERVGKPVIWLSSEVLGPYDQAKDVYDGSQFFRFVLRLVNAVDKRIVNSYVDPIITCSALNRRLIKERYGRDSLVLQTGVDYDFFNVDVPDAKAQLGLGNGPLLLHVGALTQRKSQVLSIRAFKRVKPQLVSAKLVLVGEGPWRSILEREVQMLGLGEDVVFMGVISEDMLRVVYHACDVNLYTVKDQTWGLVPFEALAAGKVSIVANGVGAAEVIGRGKMGFLINPSAGDLADAVLFALNHPELTADMVKNGQRYVRENLTWYRYAAGMFCVLKTLCVESK